MALPKNNLYKANIKKKDSMLIDQDSNDYIDNENGSNEEYEANEGLKAKGSKAWNKYKKQLPTNQSVTETIRQQTKEMIQNYQKGINENHVKVASMMSKGLRDEEIVDALCISYDYLDELRNNPAFIGEVSKLTSQFTLSNKDLRLQQLARVSDSLFNSIIDSDFSEMTLDQKINHKTRIDKIISDMNDKKETTNTMDITVRLKQMGLVMKQNSNGQRIIESNFPSLLDENIVIDNDLSNIINDSSFQTL